MCHEFAPLIQKYFGLGHEIGHDHAPHYGRGGWRKLWAEPFSEQAVSEAFSREFREFSKTGPKTPEKRLFGEKRLY